MVSVLTSPFAIATLLSHPRISSLLIKTEKAQFSKPTPMHTKPYTRKFAKTSQHKPAKIQKPKNRRKPSFSQMWMTETSTNSGFAISASSFTMRAI